MRKRSFRPISVDPSEAEKALYGENSRGPQEAMADRPAYLNDLYIGRLEEDPGCGILVKLVQVCINLRHIQQNIAASNMEDPEKLKASQAVLNAARELQQTATIVEDFLIPRPAGAHS